MIEATTKKRGEPKPSQADLSPNVSVLLSAAQVCAALGGISIRTLRGMISVKDFPRADTMIGALPRWQGSTVNAWIAEKCRASKPNP